MKKERNLRILKGSICAVLGLAGGYALYSLRKMVRTIEIEHIIKDYMEYHSGDNNLESNDTSKNREYIKLDNAYNKGNTK